MADRCPICGQPILSWREDSEIMHIIDRCSKSRDPHGRAFIPEMKPALDRAADLGLVKPAAPFTEEQRRAYPNLKQGGFRTFLTDYGKEVAQGLYKTVREAE